MVKAFGGYTVSAEVFAKVKEKAKYLTGVYQHNFPGGRVSASFIVNEALAMVLHKSSLDKRILGKKLSTLEKHIKKWGKSYVNKGKYYPCKLTHGEEFDGMMRAAKKLMNNEE